IGINGDTVRVELRAPGGATKVLLLTRADHAGTASRYFNVSAGDGAAASDVGLVGKVLDRVFTADPYQVLPPPPSQNPVGGGPLGSDGRGVRALLARHASDDAGIRYTVIVVLGLALGLCACLFVLWGAAVPSADAGAMTISGARLLSNVAIVALSLLGSTLA